MTGVLLAGLSIGAMPSTGVSAAVATSANDTGLAPEQSDQVSDNAAAWSSGTLLAATQTPGWSIVKSPSINTGQRQNVLTGITCVSASDCWAVGWYLNDNFTSQTITEHWNGSIWSVVPSKNTSATQENSLNAVTCTSASNCWAVGYYFSPGSVEQTLIERWNGTSWKIVTSPNANATLPNILNAVTCASESDCWAVGTTGRFPNEIPQTLIEHWNGSSWAIVRSPNTSSNDGNHLFGVSCASTSNCWAVGHFWSGAGTGTRTLVLRWNGVSWAKVTSPTPLNSVPELHSVTCASTSDCWAVGAYNGPNTNGYYRTLIIHWNGLQWKIVTSPNPSVEQDNYLYGVSCGSSSDCWAAGWTGFYQPIIERWNGTSWKVVTGADVGPEQSQLYGVACSAVSQCWGVGYYTVPINTPQTLIERWNGTSWDLAKSANKNIAIRPNDLFDIGCASPSDCWAVGYYDSDFARKTLIVHWNGTSWARTASPNPTDNNLLKGVTCLSASDCFAVGYTEPSHPLTGHWDGRRWTIVASSDEGHLNDVACASTSDCWAVGSYYNVTYGNLQPFIEHWNGMSWSVVTAPTASIRYSELFGVTCASTSNCWAVGYYQDANFVSRALIERWNGTKWSVVSSQNIGTSSSLQDVTCTSPTDCWAVGLYTNGNAQRTLIERWRGSAWAIVTSPNTSSTQNNALYGVTCASGLPCFAVGQYGNSSGNQTLIEQWNGTSWTIVSSPNPGPERNALNRVTCTSDSTCWAIGEYPGGVHLHPQTLIEKYSP